MYYKVGFPESKKYSSQIAVLCLDVFSCQFIFWCLKITKKNHIENATTHRVGNLLFCSFALSLFALSLYLHFKNESKSLPPKFTLRATGAIHSHCSLQKERWEQIAQVSPKYVLFTMLSPFYAQNKRANCSS